jgi:hypothetical protein
MEPWDERFDVMTSTPVHSFDIVMGQLLRR